MSDTATLPPWHLTEEFANQFYGALGFNDALAAHALERLRGPAADEYRWTQYLTRENVPEGIDELVDFCHYMMFEMLRSYKLEAEEGLPRDRAEAARQRFMLASKATIQALVEARAGAAELHD